MSINWVMLDASKGFVKLPKEIILFESPPRTTLTLQTPNTYPGKEPFSLTCNGGTVYLTNQRIVYLPTTSTPRFQSFAAPILNLQDTHVSAPFFGPNAWTGVLLPVTGGGIPPQHAYVEIKMTFRDGGAYDFDTKFVNIKETLSQQIELARESGRVTGSAVNVDLSTVHLEQLPAYEEIGGGGAPAPAAAAAAAPAPAAIPQVVQPIPIAHNVTQRPPQPVAQIGSSSTAQQSAPFEPPNEPPPGYEEAQQSGVSDSLEESLRRSLS